MVVELFTDLGRENKFETEIEKYYFRKMLSGESDKEITYTPDINTFIQKINNFLTVQNSDETKIELLYYLFNLLKKTNNYILKNY
jgi:hypothetical protein